MNSLNHSHSQPPTDDVFALVFGRDIPANLVRDILNNQSQNTPPHQGTNEWKTHGVFDIKNGFKNLVDELNASRVERIELANFQLGESAHREGSVWMVDLDLGLGFDQKISPTLQEFLKSEVDRRTRLGTAQNPEGSYTVHLIAIKPRQHQISRTHVDDVKTIDSAADSALKAGGSHINAQKDLHSSPKGPTRGGRGRTR